MGTNSQIFSFSMIGTIESRPMNRPIDKIFIYPETISINYPGMRYFIQYQI
jgi:hypothetical protein